MPGPEVYAGCPFMGRFAGRGLDPSQTVKKLHSCLLAYVGATMGRPSTYCSNAFFDSPDFIFIVRRAAAVCNVE